MTPLNTHGCATAPGALSRPGSPPISSTQGSTKPSARPTKSCAWDRCSSRTIAARWPITRTTIGKRTGTLRACLWFPIPRLSTAIPETPSAWCCTCKRRPAAASGCWTDGPSWRSILEEGLTRQSADKLKAVRLLGRHPIEAVDDRNVLMVFVACQAIEGRAGKLIPEIWNELRKFERKPYAQRLIGRGIEKLTPANAAAARQALFNIIDRATAQIALKAEAHRVRAEINDSLAADRLLFDDSPEAERLRRFDLACGRGLARSLDSLLKLRRAPELGRTDFPSSGFL